MEYTGGDLMYTEVFVSLFGLLLFTGGILLGIHYENHRIMRMIEEAMEEEKNIKKCCGNCWLFNGNYCTKLWNNADECYKDVYRDSHDPYDDACEDWEYDPMWSPEDY